MADPRFYSVAGPFNLESLANFSDTEIRQIFTINTTEFTDVAALSNATIEHVSFIDNRKYVHEFENTDAGAIVVPPDLIERAPEHASLLISKHPYRAYANIAKAFYPNLVTTQTSLSNTLISPTAIFNDSVSLDVGVVIKEDVTIGDNTFVGSNTVIERGVNIGQNSWVGSNVSLSYCLIGERAVIHPGVRIGQDGYGFAPGSMIHEKIPQLGRVIIGDDVEIGANTCIDRGASLDTEIGDGTKLDNLVQIGHNVKIGKGCFLAGQVGIAGSSQISDFVMIGGQAGVSGHLKIEQGAKIAAQAGVTKNIPPGETVVGFPATNARRFWKNIANLKRITEQVK